MFEAKIVTDCYAPQFNVEIEKQPLFVDEVISINIDETLEKPAMFTLTLNEKLDMDSQELTWLDKNRSLIMPGNKVCIFFGYVSHSEEFKGVIKALSPSFPSSGVPTLNVQGYDFSHALQKTVTKFKDKKVKYSDVAKEIAKKNSLSDAGVEDTRKKYSIVKRKKNERDYALLERVAKKIGFEFFVRNDILYFREPRDTGDKKASFEFRKNIISFSPRLTTAPTVHEVIVTGWNAKTKKKIKETAKFSDIKSNIGIPDFEDLIENTKGKKTKKKIEGRVMESKEEAKILAIAELKRANKGFISGSLEITGNPYLRPGINIEITITKPKSKPSKNWFNGMYYITGTKHSFSDSGYTTTLEVRRCL